MRQCALWAALTALVLGSGASAQPKEGKKTLVVYAKATSKLSARLRAVQLCEGTAVGKVTGNGAVIEVAAAKAGGVENRLRAAGATLASEKPAKEEPIEELVLSYKKAPSAAQLQKMGLRLVGSHEHEDGVVLLVRVVKALDAALVARLEKEANLTHAETN